MNIKEYTFEAELRGFLISHVSLLVLVSFCHITNNYKYQANSNRHFSLVHNQQLPEAHSFWVKGRGRKGQDHPGKHISSLH